MSLSRRTVDELRSSVGEYASLLYHLSTPPEKAVIEIKSMVRDAVTEPGSRAEALTSLVVRWAVNAYYAA